MVISHFLLILFFKAPPEAHTTVDSRPTNATLSVDSGEDAGSSMIEVDEEETDIEAENEQLDGHGFESDATDYDDGDDEDGLSQDSQSVEILDEDSDATEHDDNEE